MTPIDPDNKERERIEREFRTFIRESFRDKEEDHRRRLDDARAFFSGDLFKKADKLDRLRRFVRDRVGEMESWGDAALDDRMRVYLADCRALMNEFPAVFPMRPTEDATILCRLDEIGPYDLVRDRRSDTINWPSPARLSCDWSAVELYFDVQTEGGQDAAYRDVLARWDEFRPHADRLFDELRDAMVGHFGSVYEDGRSAETLEEEGYLLDADGFVTDGSILSCVGPLAVVLSNVLYGAVFRCVVPWDDEHRFEAEADENWEFRTDG